MNCILNCALTGEPTRGREPERPTRYGRESVYRAHVVLLRQICEVHGHAPSNVISGCSAVVIGRLRSSFLVHRLVWCVTVCAVFLRGAFRNVRLRACMSGCSAAQCSLRGDIYTTFALIPVFTPAYCTICTPSCARFLRLGSAPTGSHSRYRSLF
ncbi:hypothetical protein EVAR_84643_1 [Eumeta japonica]|uniref:Uncharacterized protein n=1 Tax=Eumeta variegata TaxID=151549 RepID=A0A4C1UYG4_EUMVA|nr:hypothetical protein EVAR_84643_1 [Eumeta japonica]